MINRYSPTVASTATGNDELKKSSTCTSDAAISPTHEDARACIGDARASPAECARIR
ncbi:hypothetical protein [Nannocystis punicea]|uniref:Uncharacterized protein n=1 Tax=Nannocystis punicea TaxID=2995304 RepID=A0ABY7HEU1_9BACT|nr:hypothetical protein [Nannocystis poenicansa]WAS97798.1 hypothetical protein O0S08_16780 [Nannocystis poenicansa]